MYEGRERSKAFVNEAKRQPSTQEVALTNISFTLSYPRNLLVFLIYSLYFTFCRQAHPRFWGKMNIVWVSSIAQQK